MARERELTITLDRVVWDEFQRRLQASGRSGERGAASFVINEWLRECMYATGRGASAFAPPPPSIPVAPLSDDDDLDFDQSKLT